MATIDTSYVRKHLKAIIATSKAVSKLVREALEALETDPSQFPELDTVPKTIEAAIPNATFRKIKLEHNPHSFRLIVIHWYSTRVRITWT